MNAYEVGDWVLIRAQVTKVYGSDIGYSVELFSKTDQYEARIRDDLIISTTAAPKIPEPDRNSVVIDREGDVWRYAGGPWKEARSRATSSWDRLIASYGPVKVYGEIS